MTAARPEPGSGPPVRTGRPGRPRGRRPGGADTRDALLGAARVEFAERGYEGATVRRIAERAGVDAAMVNHWFGGKEALFTASLDIPVSPTQILALVVPGDPERLGERLVATFLSGWDATGGHPLTALVQSVAAHDDAARMLREFVLNVLVGPIVRTVAPDRPELRATLVGTQMIGLGVVRYLLRLEPLASTPPAAIVPLVAPTVQRYLTGAL